MKEKRIQKCLDCKKEISKNSERCKSCSNRNRKGKYNTNKHKDAKGYYYSNGYKYIYLYNLPKTQSGVPTAIAEHRLIMKKYLKRNLKLKETVHHINGIKDDNRIENLQVVSNSKHAKIEGFGKFWKGKRRDGKGGKMIRI